MPFSLRSLVGQAGAHIEGADHAGVGHGAFALDRPGDRVQHRARRREVRDRDREIDDRLALARMLSTRPCMAVVARGREEAILADVFMLRCLRNL
jgi:hypothetical protein